MGCHSAAAGRRAVGQHLSSPRHARSATSASQVSAVVAIVGARRRLRARPAMASSCSEQRQNLLACLADSPCVAAGRTHRECMEVAGRRLQGLALHGDTSRKRGQLDMRKRIKGNLPQHVDDTEEDNFGGRLLEIQRRKREEDEGKAHFARS